MAAAATALNPIELCEKCEKVLFQPGRRIHGLRKSVLELQTGSEAKCRYCTVILSALWKLIPAECLTGHNANFRDFFWSATGGHTRSVMQYLARERNWIFSIQLVKEPKTSKPPSVTLEGLWNDICVTGHKIPEITSSETSINQVNLWMGSCISEHQHCKGTLNTSNFVPTRLVHVCYGLLGYEIRLEELNSPQVYLCLSHCWGNSQQQPFKTTRSNLLANMTQILWSELPKTFQDALEFTHLLGYQYLWIDSLCIIQDDSSDWLRESGRMGQVFGNAILTLAATTSKDSHGGLHGGCELLYQGARLELAIASHSEPTYARFRLDHKLDHWPLMRRAWVYQERLLSRRILHFAQRELIWDCNTWQKCQCTADDSAFPKLNASRGKIDHARSMADSTGELMNRWLDIITEYSQLALTHHTDRLVALSGIANQIQERQTGISYLAGMWHNDLLRQMTWMLRVQGKGVRPNDWHAPTWSWVSVSSGVYFEPGLLSTTRFISPRTTLIKTHCTSSNDDATVSIDPGAFIDISGPCISGVLKYIHGLQYLLIKDHKITSFRSDYNLAEAGPYHVPNGTQVDVVEVGQIKKRPRGLKSICIVLRRRSVDCGESSAYERIGLCSEPFHDSTLIVLHNPPEQGVPPVDTWHRSAFRIY